MSNNLRVPRFVFFALIMLLVFAPLSPVNARSVANATSTLPPPPTPITPVDGGSIFAFPIQPGAPIGQPDQSDPNMVASGSGNPSVAAPITAIEDDRENNDPTNWYVYEHQTLTAVINTATTNNLRVVDLYVENPASPYQSTAVYVSNTGSYARTWWLLADVTPATLLNFAISNNARIVILKAFNDAAPGGDVRFFAVMISNTGADAKTWYFYKDQTVAGITTLWQANTARIVQVNSYVRNSTTLYDVVMVSNTGADARSWWWYVNATPADIVTHLNANNARLVDLDIDPTTGNYNVVMQSCSGGCPAWWWYTGVSTSNLVNTVTANGARIIDANVTSGCGDQCWAILLMDNSHTTIAGNAVLPAVKLTYSNGGAQTSVADASGSYNFSVPVGWTGTLTPSKPGYQFVPASRSYTSVFSNKLGEDFSATAVATFVDVPVPYWSWQFIERLYSAGITGGCLINPLSYCPEADVTRAQMAVFLLRGEHGSTYAPPDVGTGTGFGDVPSTHWAAAWIKQLALEGITSGCGPGLYCPETSVTRDQMAVFLLRAEHGASYTPPPATGVFTDVPATYWAAAWIERLAAEGITGGCGVGTYCPTTPVTRAQMAVFLVRTFNLP